MKTFQVKCKILNKEDLNYLWSCSDEVSEYYNSMLNTLRIDFEIKSQWPKKCRTYLSKYELQKQYSSKVLGFKPKRLLNCQKIGISNRLFDSIKSFYALKKINKNANFPFKEKKFDLFNPLYFSFNKSSRNILIQNDNEIELTFQNHKKIILKCIYTRKYQLSKLKLRPEGHKLIFKDGCFYFHFCIDDQKESLPINNKSIFIDLGQKDLVTGFCPETKSVIKVSGSPLKILKVIKKKEAIQSLRDKKKRNSIRYNKLKRTLKRLQRKDTNQKRTFLHKVSKYIITNYDVIVLGDLKNIKENTKSNIKNINKYKFERWPVALFVDMINYKALKSSNRLFYKINESNTTKKCCVCGQLRNVTLSERTYHCENCGNLISRDSNSSINIYDKFMQFDPKLFSSEQSVNRTELIGALKTKVLRVM